MPIEERIVEWSKQRPRWQQIVLRAVADGRTLSDEALAELIEATVEGKGLPGGELEIGHLVASGADAPPVSLESVFELAHVNALSTTAPLTFPGGSLTIVYGDNGSGKSGYARLLKRIAKSRHNETVLTDVFRDTRVDEPTAKLGVRIGDEPHEISWPKSEREELQRMLFYDRACGDAYIAEEADFPYRPYALFVMDGLIDACSRMRALIGRKLYENAGSARRIPRASEETSRTEVARFLANIHAGSSIQKLDELLGKLDSPAMSKGAVESQEAALRSSDTRQVRQNLKRTAERLDALCKHIELVDSVLGADAISSANKARDELLRIEQAAEQHAESLRSEALAGVGGEVWRVLWDSAKRFSEGHAYVGQPFPVMGEESRCVLCLQQLGDSGSGVLSRLDQFVKGDIQVRREETRSTYAALVEKRKSFKVFGDAINSHMKDLEAPHQDDVDVVRTLLDRYEAVQQAVDTTQSREAEGEIQAAEVQDVIGSLRNAAAEARKLADDLADPELIARRLSKVMETRREIELLMEAMDARNDIAAEITRLGVRSRLEDLKQAANTGPVTRKILDLSEDTIRGGPQSLDRLAAKLRWYLLSIICCQIEQSSSSLSSSKLYCRCCGVRGREARKCGQAVCNAGALHRGCPHGPQGSRRSEGLVHKSTAQGAGHVPRVRYPAILTSMSHAARSRHWTPACTSAGVRPPNAECGRSRL